MAEWTAGQKISLLLETFPSEYRQKLLENFSLAEREALTLQETFTGASGSSTEAVLAEFYGRFFRKWSVHSPFIGFLAKLNPVLLAEFFRLQHPQMATLIFSALSSDCQKEVLSSLTPERREEIQQRLKNSIPPVPFMLRFLDGLLQENFAEEIGLLRTDGAGGK